MLSEQEIKARPRLENGFVNEFQHILNHRQVKISHASASANVQAR
ncbi:MAG: hypothetical protein WA667_24650 [Candidatus Nitrosopolaris sp.]